MTNKAIVTILAVSMLVLGLASGLYIRSQSAPPKAFGGVSSGDLYSTTSTSNASLACGTASTQIVGASSGRRYFAATVASSTNITLCKAATCVQGAGLTINASGGSFEQKLDDYYIGPWSCIGNGATSTIGYIANQ